MTAGVGTTLQFRQYDNNPEPEWLMYNNHGEADQGILIHHPDKQADTTRLAIPEHYEYDMPNGRRFLIWYLAHHQPELIDTPYLIEERQPTGYIWRTPAARTACYSPIVGRARQSPNTLVHDVRLYGIQASQIIRAGSGAIPYDRARLFANMPDCFSAIQQVLATNTWYNPVQSSKDLSIMTTTAAAPVSHTLQDKKTRHDEARRKASGIFKGLHNQQGPLDQADKMAILSFINDPTCQHWQAIADICIKDEMTLHDVWHRIDPRIPAGSDEKRPTGRGYPPPGSLREALVQLGQTPF